MVHASHILTRSLELAAVAAANGFANASTSTNITARATIDWSIPTAWDKPSSIPTSFSKLEGTAQGAFNAMKTQFWKDPNNIGIGWDWGTSLSSFAYKDMVSSTRSNYDYLKKALAAAKKHNSHFDPYSYNDDAQWWGTTAMYAHRAYGDKIFLDYAVDVWKWVAQAQITQAQADAGKSPLRVSSFNSTCNGKTVAGGVFWRSKSSDGKDMSTNVVTTALFQTLSAYLAEKTGEEKYIKAGKNAYNFMINHLMFESPNIPQDSLNVATCKKNGWVFTYNAGKFIEGSIILSGITKDKKMRDQALRTIVAAIKSTKNWQNAKGHITEAQGGDPTKSNTGRQFKSVFVRSLTEAYRRLYNNKDARNLIRRYINIQYHDITTLNRDGNLYGSNWRGPFKKGQWGQANVLDALTAGVEVNWSR
ncbi:Six-hairpin glycosidase [Auriculariales sp. MPI-PUGE-AT-0066]|nr:Six-hairpin glycosidase [Auriculariales sp. MPI-PUGE-AT-0066]